MKKLSISICLTFIAALSAMAQTNFQEQRVKDSVQYDKFG
ncbi:MAG: hypothetical protein ACJAQ2_002554, partial [Vicingaceae bacterium]